MLTFSPLFFCSSLKLQHCRTIALLHWLPKKHRAISRQEKMTFSSPGRVALGLPSPSPRVCTDGQKYVRAYVRVYADVRTKFSRIDRLPNLNLLTNGAPLALRAWVLLLLCQNRIARNRFVFMYLLLFLLLLLFFKLYHHRTPGQLRGSLLLHSESPSVRF